MKKRIVFLLCIIAFVSSCSKDERPKLKESNSIEKRVLNPEETIMKNKLALTAQLVRDVIREKPGVVKEVSGLIKLKMYKDDFIYFKDLFNPEENSKIKGLNVSQTLFEKTFDEILSRKSNPDFNFNIKEFLVANAITLYCPYPVEDYPTISQLPSCTSDPIDNEYENTGYQLEDDGSFRMVVVDEEYSENYPVWIVIQEEPETELSTPTPTLSNNVHQMRVGYVKCTKQYDGIFGGGSEFRFCILGGTITLNTASSFSALQSCDLTRCQIRNGKWVNFQYELDDDWYVSNDGTTDEGARQFGLIEFDKYKKEYTLSFEPKVKIDKIEVSAFKVELTLQSNEGWIKLDNYQSRDNFIKFNKTDMGHGLQGGYRVYVAGDVYWTLPVIQY
jgi:hypothetical protein